MVVSQISTAFFLNGTFISLADSCSCYSGMHSEAIKHKEHQHIAIKKVVVAAYDEHNWQSLSSSSYTHNFMKCRIVHEDLQTPSKKS